MNTAPHTVALTGGIACGKTTASNHFATLNIPIIDTDLIARDLVKPGEAALQEISDHFGLKVLTPDGELNRAFMRDEIFNKPDEKAVLESILHPRILDRLARDKQRYAGYCYILIVIPLLAQVDIKAPFHSVLTVECAETLQIQRLCQRDRISESLALKMINSQASRSSRINLADQVLYNNDNLESFIHDIEKIHHHYCRQFNCPD